MHIARWLAVDPRCSGELFPWKSVAVSVFCCCIFCLWVSCFWDVSYAIPVHVVRVKSYVYSFFVPPCAPG